MNKIIINSIDVSECFKQLKHLQEKNKKLKEQLCETKQFLKDVSKENSKFCQQIEAYQLSENEVKKIIAELKHKNKKLQEENKKLKEFKDSLNNKLRILPSVEPEIIDKTELYKQALEKIKNIAELDVCYNAKLDKYTFNTNAQRILDTINEVLK